MEEKKTQKMSENGEIYTAGTDGMDKFHLCFLYVCFSWSSSNVTTADVWCHTNVFSTAISQSFDVYKWTTIIVIKSSHYATYKWMKIKSILLQFCVRTSGDFVLLWSPPFAISDGENFHKAGASVDGYACENHFEFDEDLI